MTTPNKIRVQKHRAKLRGNTAGAWEVCISISVIENVRAIAKQKELPMWVPVQDALIDYVTGHATSDERPGRVCP